MRYLFLLRHSPYGNTLAREALDMALATAAFDQTVQLLFMNDGVYQLIPDQDTRLAGRKNVSKTLEALPLYEIDQVYVDQASLEKRGLSLASCLGNPTAATTEMISELVRNADKVLSF